MELGYSGERDNNFKDDIKPRSLHGFDTRDVRVRRQSIGWLDDNYLGVRSILQPPFTSATYTRIPPLATLPTLFDRESIKAAITTRSRGVIAAIALGLLTTYAWLRAKVLTVRAIALGYLPKSYSFKRGVFVNWAALRDKTVRFVEPAILVAIAITALAIYGVPNAKNHSGNAAPGSPSAIGSSSAPTYTSPTSSSKPSSSNSSSSTSTNSSPAPSSSSLSASPSNYPSTTTAPSPSAPSSSTSTITNSSSSPSSTSSTTSSSPPPSSTSSSSGGSSSSTGSTSTGTTLTVPGVNTFLGGKTLLSTSPLSLTLN